MAYLHDLSQGSTVVFAINIITCNQNVICNTNNIGSSLKILSILHWNMLPVLAAWNGSLKYLYLPNWHAKVAKYDNFLLNFRLCYPELSAVSVKYHVH